MEESDCIDVVYGFVSAGNKAIISEHLVCVVGRTKEIVLKLILACQIGPLCCISILERVIIGDFRNFGETIGQQDDVLDILHISRTHTIQKALSLLKCGSHIGHSVSSQIIDLLFCNIHVSCKYSVVADRVAAKSVGSCGEAHDCNMVNVTVTLDLIAELGSSFFQLLNGIISHAPRVVKDQDCPAVDLLPTACHRRCRQHSQDHAQRQQSA